MEVECALLTAQALFGCQLDESKCFESLVRRITLPAGDKLGMPERFADAGSRFYAALLRTFKYGASVGTWWNAVRGLAQGCSLSIIWVAGNDGRVGDDGWTCGFRTVTAQLWMQDAGLQSFTH